MSKYNSLRKLYSEIELLESAGLIKAANVLHKKFIKEAQAKSADDLMREIFILAQNPGPDFDNLILYVKRMLDSSPAYNEDQIEAIKRSIEKAQKQRQNIGTFSTTIAPPNQTLAPAQSAVPTTAPSTPSVQDPTAPIGQLSDQVKAEQADILWRGLGNTIQTGKENMDIQPQYRLTPQENAAENQLYTKTINEIKKLLTGNQQQRNYARGLYESTRNKFKNPKRQYYFDQQYAAIERDPNKKQ